MKTVRGKTWGVSRGKQYVRGWINPYRPALEELREEQERPDIACLYYGDLENETPEQFILRQEEATLLNHALTRLYPREERVVRLWYGIGGEKLTLDQIGEQYGVTRERIRQISCKAERKMLRYLKHDFRERFLSKAKRHNWWWELEKTKEAEDKAKEAQWAKEREEREAARQLEAERIARQKQEQQLEVDRIRADNARQSAYQRQVASKLYVPRLIDPTTGAWEWVALSELEDDASAA